MSPRLRSLRTKALLGAAVATTTLVLTTVPALANTSIPTGINAVATANGNGTVTVVVTGTWQWPDEATGPNSPGINCSQRYGTGISVGWWGIGSATTPAPNFTLTAASEITATGQGINGTAPSTGSVAPTGTVKFSATDPTYPSKYFYVGDYYSSSEIFTPTFCTAAQPGQSSGPGAVTTAFSGTYSATATYPQLSDVPAHICVNTYDEHGTQGNPSASPPGGGLSADFSPSQDDDNAITVQPGQTVSQWNTAGATDCGTTDFVGTELPSGWIHRTDRDRRSLSGGSRDPPGAERAPSSQPPLGQHDCRLIPSDRALRPRSGEPVCRGSRAYGHSASRRPSSTPRSAQTPWRAELCQAGAVRRSSESRSQGPLQLRDLELGCLRTMPEDGVLAQGHYLAEALRPNLLPRIQGHACVTRAGGASSGSPRPTQETSRRHPASPRCRNQRRLLAGSGTRSRARSPGSAPRGPERSRTACRTRRQVRSPRLRLGRPGRCVPRPVPSG